MSAKIDRVIKENGTYYYVSGLTGKKTLIGIFESDLFRVAAASGEMAMAVRKYCRSAFDLKKERRKLEERLRNNEQELFTALAAANR